ncbi:uncharacterized protein LOC119297555 [Triticum dicoccoides]|uniref:uncharacterized protein LOC119297555 n=1 Tax=Triticum dicoccoides TaxID=85692 RepID=UPI00188FDFD7|nr:uncharacterized protein LOC119297555 [Triticum dicoccoides]
MEDYLHEYYSLERFRAAYRGVVEPLTDRSQWPNVKLDFLLHAPLPKSSVGRKRKSRLKSCLEKGGGNYKKKPPPKGQLGSQNRCKKCKQLGHRQAGCPTNGVKKRNPKSRKIKPNTEIDVECTIPGDVLQASPRPVTRSQSSLRSPLGGMSPLAVPQDSPRPRTRSQSSLGSPTGGMSSLAVPHASPRSMTRSQSSLGSPNGGMSPLVVPHASPRPMTRSQSSLGSPLGETSSSPVIQGSPGPITRRQLSMEIETPTSPSNVGVRPAKKLTPKRRKIV